jgi:hypothetical protein
MQYSYSYLVPDTLDDNPSVFVDNVAPVVSGAMPLTPDGFEGGQTGFTAEFTDPGLDDDWWYRWLWGDGQVSGWRQVRKFSGGLNVLWVHSHYGAIGQMMDNLAAELGPALLRHEEVNVGPQGLNGPPDADYMAEFDVIIIGSNYIPGPNVGNAMADYAKQGGGVVELVAMMHPTFGIGGRWRSEGYSVYPQSGSIMGYGSTTILDPTHPIIDGYAGLVSNWGCSLSIALTSVTTGATVLAETGAYKTAAYRVEDDVHPGSGRVVGLDIFAQPGYFSGEAYKVIANAAFWAGKGSPPVPLTMPITLEPMYHVYEDDHPVTLTPSDNINVMVEVKDDDHEAIAVVGDITTVLSEDFSSGVPPTGWTKNPNTNNWRLYNGALAGGSPPEARFYWIPYVMGTYRLHSGALDTTGLTAINVNWKQYLNHYNGPYTLMVETSTDAVNWDVIWEHVNPTGFPAQDVVVTTSENVGGTMYISWTFDGNPYNLNWWHVDSIVLETFESYEMFGIGNDTTSVMIHNVFPWAEMPDGHVTQTDELTGITYADFAIADPALFEPTENFWYRWIWDDGEQTDWINKGSLAPPPLNILILHTISPQLGSMMGGLISQLQTVYKSEDLTIDEYDFGPLGTYTAPGLDFMMNYDVIIVTINYYVFNQQTLNDVGDQLADFSDAGGGVIQMTFSAGTSWYSNIAGRWSAEDYNPIPYAPNSYGYQDMGDVHEPDHPIMEGVSSMRAYYKHGATGVTSGALHIADYTTGMTLAASTDLDHHTTGGGRVVGLNFFPWPPYLGGDAMLMLANSVLWTWGEEIPTEIIPTEQHTYGDNGIYYIDLQIIDDDMWWDTSNETTGPVFLGPPGADPNDWIGHSIFPTEIYNVNPLITEPIQAFAELDLMVELKYGDKKGKYPGTNLGVTVTDNGDVIAQGESFGKDKIKGFKSLTVSYGGDPGDIISLYKGILVDNLDGTFTILPEAGKDKLPGDVKLYVNGVLNAKIHTSGSKEINVGDVFGDFTVTDFEVNWKYGQPFIEPLQIHLTKGHDYQIQLDYTPGKKNNEGIVTLLFPNGDEEKTKFKFKEKEAGSYTQTLSHSQIMDMLWEKDITFTADVYDPGSDDLMFMWDWCDGCSDSDIHLYDNDDQSSAVTGHVDGSQSIFDQLPGRDPWFDRPLNDDRSPLVNPIHIEDVIMHAFEEDKNCKYADKCKGLRSLTLEYSGGAGADLSVYKGEIVDNGDGTYTITPADGYDKLKSSTTIFLDGVEIQKIHTSCSQPIDVGYVYGDFTVVALDKIPYKDVECHDTFFVMLLVTDDDVGDGYPSYFNNDGGYDMEFVEISFA